MKKDYNEKLLNLPKLQYESSGDKNIWLYEDKRFLEGRDISKK